MFIFSTYFLLFFNPSLPFICIFASRVDWLPISSFHRKQSFWVVVRSSRPHTKDWYPVDDCIRDMYRQSSADSVTYIWRDWLPSLIYREDFVEAGKPVYGMTILYLRLYPYIMWCSCLFYSIEKLIGRGMPSGAPTLYKRLIQSPLWSVEPVPRINLFQTLWLKVFKMVY